MSTRPDMGDSATEATRAELWKLWLAEGRGTLEILLALDRENGRLLDRIALQPWEMCARNGANPDTILQMQDFRRSVQHELQNAITDLWEIPARIQALTKEMECESLALKESSSIRVTIQFASEAPQRFVDGFRKLGEILAEIQPPLPVLSGARARTVH